MSGPVYTANAARFGDADDQYWLGGVWDQDGHLVWSSEPESFGTQAEALAAAQYRIDNDHWGWPLSGRVVPFRSHHFGQQS